MADDSVHNLSDLIAESLSFRVYGRRLAPAIPLTATRQHTLASPGDTLGFVSVRAFAINGLCRKLPRPVLLALPGPGEKPAPSDTCAAPEDLVWLLSLNERTTALVPITGSIEEILDEVEMRGISGGLRLDRPRIENGKACVDVHAWAKIEIFGASTGFNERFPICIPLEGCHTVWEIGIANLQVCFRAPKQICAKLCVGKWGLSKCWDYCVDLPIAAAVEEKGGAPCACHGAEK